MVTMIECEMVGEKGRMREQVCAPPHSSQSPGNLFDKPRVSKVAQLPPSVSTRFFHLTRLVVVVVLLLTISDFARARGCLVARASRYGARLAPATHGSERRVHFGGGGELPGVAMH